MRQSSKNHSVSKHNQKGSFNPTSQLVLFHSLSLRLLSISCYICSAILLAAYFIVLALGEASISNFFILMSLLVISFIEAMFGNWISRKASYAYNLVKEQVVKNTI